MPARDGGTMRIAVAVSGVSDDDLTFVVEAERLGADSVWVAEAWGTTPSRRWLSSPRGRPASGWPPASRRWGPGRPPCWQ